MKDELKESLFSRFLRHELAVIDLPVLTLVIVLSTLGFVTLFSAGSDFPWRISGQARNYVVATIVMFVFANIPPRVLQKCAVPVFAAGIVLLTATLLFGITVKGATRWIGVGAFRVQPSEIMKLGLPLMLAWYFSLRRDLVNNWDWVISGILLAVPVILILKQPDLGTAILVGIAGFTVIFLAGIPWQWMATLGISAIAGLPVIWTLLHDYQRMRVLTLLDPTRDPLGSGFHIIQALIAIGSGGLWGKGWMQGTQAHLDFIPERTSDFLFAVYSEEFGLVGNCVLLGVYLLLVLRSAVIAVNAKDTFCRLLAGSITAIFFTYTFVNIGMVSGILPVVGVPLPFMSYGGTALVILGTCAGILMSINAYSKIKNAE
ncbi:MAG: rod shape-determining protein RodA [Duodenibacillus sp.]|nr:rod shape-determining protein RodA [Duodenibacillus sp.]HBC69338.1 rod shape-determining protein RodA [Sutterella sp.]